MYLDSCPLEHVWNDKRKTSSEIAGGQTLNPLQESLCPPGLSLQPTLQSFPAVQRRGEIECGIL